MGEEGTRWGLGPWRSVVRALLETVRLVFCLLSFPFFTVPARRLGCGSDPAATRPGPRTVELDTFETLEWTPIHERHWRALDGEPE